MTVEMYLDGRLVDSNPLLAAMLRHSHYLPEMIRELVKRNKECIARSVGQPSFYLCGVASCMNRFVPLGR